MRGPVDAPAREQGEREHRRKDQPRPCLEREVRLLRGQVVGREGDDEHRGVEQERAFAVAEPPALGFGKDAPAPRGCADRVGCFGSNRHRSPHYRPGTAESRPGACSSGAAERSGEHVECATGLFPGHGERREEADRVRRGGLTIRPPSRARGDRGGVDALLRARRRSSGPAPGWRRHRRGPRAPLAARRPSRGRRAAARDRRSRRARRAPRRPPAGHPRRSSRGRPAPSVSAYFGAATQAPAGRPPPSAFAVVITSGLTGVCS